MVGELFAGIGAFKTMLDLAKRFKDINDATTRNAVAIELQEKILAAQEQQTALVQRVSELEKEMARFETWEAEKKRYSLAQFVPGTVAYILKRSEANGEPGHALCANCYDRGKKSVLQFNGETFLPKFAYVCPSCKYSMNTQGQQPPEYVD
jgi:Zn finger protein HypA/HybF involved in hydrogenase expression